jgi:hypothetical protein
MNNVLEILVVESMGPFLKAQKPWRILWFHAIQVRDGVDDARVVALTRSLTDEVWEERIRSVLWQTVREILGLLSEVGIPGRELRVKGTLDTSDTWSKLMLRIQLDGRVFTLDLEMMASGYEGEDAEALGRLLKKLEGLIGEDDGSKDV